MEIEAYEKFTELDLRHFWRRSKRELVLKTLGGYVSKTGSLAILDIGGAASLISSELERFGRVTVVEPDEGMAAVARERQGLNVRIGRLPGDLPIDSPVDLVTLLDVLEHVEDDRAALSEIRTILKPGGILVVTVPALKWLWSHHDVALHHHRRYLRNELRNLLEDCGFEVLRISYWTTLLLPLVIVQRRMVKLRRGVRDQPRYQVSVPPQPLNALFGGIMLLERGLLRITNLPVGSSILAVCTPR